MDARADEWLFGWDATPGIVSVWAELDGRAWVWRRSAHGERVLRERVRFEPWLLLASLADLEHLGGRLRGRSRAPGADDAPFCVEYEELEGPGALRFLVRAADGRELIAALLRGASRRLGRTIGHVRELDQEQVLMLPPEEQYLVASGRTYFRGLAFDDLRRLQFDLETTGLDPQRERVFMVAVRDPEGETSVLQVAGEGDAAERDLLHALIDTVQRADPDVIENHNLHGFDLPFLAERARCLGVTLALGRAGGGLRLRPAARGFSLGQAAGAPRRRLRYSMVGREAIDTHDAVLRHDFSARDLPGHGLKAVARHFGVSPAAREYIAGRSVHAVFLRDPERVRRYAGDDVEEAAAIARLLGGAAFALAGMVPRRYERLADAGAATGVIDPLLLRAYLRAGAALPARQRGDGTQHSGAALYLFGAGVARRVVKADVASLYPSLMRQYAIGPRSDRLQALLVIVDRLVEARLAAKARARQAAAGSSARFADEALSAAMKLVVNSAYGYLGAVGLTRFADVHAANEVTRHGRELLGFMCQELAARGGTLLQADTDGVYFAVPESWDEADERRVVAEVAALLPPRVQLEFEGRYAAMLSHEPKNYALQTYAPARLILRGVAFHSRRAEPFGEAFLRAALPPLLAGDLPAVRAVYLQSCDALRRRTLPVSAVAAQVRLTKTSEEYLAVRARRRELVYEALLASGRAQWATGERVRVYRGSGGRPLLLPELDAEDPNAQANAVGDTRDYDVAYYLRVLRETFATRLARALRADDFAAVVADAEQTSLFAPSLEGACTILTRVLEPETIEQ